jgi:hypothetical protein
MSDARAQPTQQEVDKTVGMLLDLMAELITEGSKGNPLGGVPESFLHLALQSELRIDYHTTMALVGKLIASKRIARTHGHLLMPGEN